MHTQAPKLELKKIKNFVLLGFGKTTISTVKFLLKNHTEAKIKISELKEKEAFDLSQISELENKGISFEFGKQSKEFIFEKDCFIIISPGIPPKASIIQELLRSDLNWGTDLDLFAASLNPEQNYLAITGTNGKTTTTALASHIFNSPSLGNIGTPFLEFDKDHYSNFACEISSFQIFYSRHFQELRIPKVSIFLNFTADHLDWHKDLNEYFETKTKLFCQSNKEENYWLLNFDDPKVKNFGLKAEMIKDSKTRICYFANHDISYTLSESCPFVAYQKNDRLFIAQYLGDASRAELNQDAIVSTNDHGDYFLEIPILKTNELSLVGKHNYSNILSASLAAFLMGYDIAYLLDCLRSFKPVPHRLEFIREIGANKIYNDSKATNPDSSLKAIDSFDRPIVILGGKDKNLDLTNFLEEVSKKAYAVIAIGELKDKIHNKLREFNFEKIRRAESLEEAFSLAILYTENNSYPILLSPASSSFDMFSGFEDRGNQFREIALKY